jgi:cytochrome c-type biogenesis protein
MAPVLGVVFSVASAHPAQAIALMASFGIGHCAVIVASGGAASTVQRYLNWTEQSRGAKYLKRIAGGLVLLGGIYYISAVL